MNTQNLHIILQERNQFQLQEIPKSKMKTKRQFRKLNQNTNG